MANTKVSTVYGVNENGEVVVAIGTGSNNIVGYIPASELPVDISGKMVLAGVGAGGVSGKSILNGTAAPSNAYGADGEFYLNTTTSVLYGPKVGGAWPISGTSLTGPAGSTVLSGSGVPPSGTGNNGDFYIDTAAIKLYGPKAAGAWPGTGTALIGAPGNTLLSGTTAPSAGTGRDGDFYMNTTASLMYGPKANGVWPAGVSMVGAGGGGAVNAVSSYTKFFYPGARDVSSNVMNKGPNPGDAAKRGTSTNANNAGAFTSVAGTYGTSGTGRYWQAPAGNSHFDPNAESFILHIGFAKAQPATGTEYIAGSQINSSTPGIQLATVSNGNTVLSYKPGNVQNNFSSITGLLDGARHSITFVFDRLTKNGYLYVDSVLRQTKQDFNMTGTPGTPQGFVFGGYSGTPACYDADFFNCQMYAVPKDVADMNIQAMVDKMMLYSQPLTVADLGA